ncbi:MAG: GtrA family protein [Bacilli bacterium]|jgi:putative flippase GtrA|nr:GtrA family protein [Bacilli bacterium]MDD3389334.1 GtrA family protein [Bacilli bacterium]MDD4344898.1 GtrA family protein [Bacilli bacterium]MDD4521175.1 GtrA family protein [Bacilli bacterium]MDY0399543.1 GtrA family protein [Bacilli bacterium]
MKRIKKETINEIIRFLIVGGGATAVDYLFYNLSYYLVLAGISDQAWFDGFIKVTPRTVYATLIGFTFGVIVNYIFSILFVFRNVANKKTARSIGGYAIFVLLGIVGLFLNIGIKGLGEIIIPLNSNFWWNSFVFAFATGIVLIYNYVSRKLILFKPKNDLNDTQVELQEENQEKTLNNHDN